MYDAFYGLSGKPFQLTPDQRFYFVSQGHHRAMAYLRYGLEQGEGFIVITGGIGTGKTMLVRNLFSDAQGGAAAARVGGLRRAGLTAPRQPRRALVTGVAGRSGGQRLAAGSRIGAATETASDCSK